MSKPDGGPAFPFATHTQDQRGIPIAHIRDGMTLRDYFAAKALSGIGVLPWSERGSMDGFAEYCSASARTAYAVADAMLAERSK